MATLQEIEARIRNEAQREYARQQQAEAEQAERNACYARKNAASAKAEAPLRPAFEAAKAKATVIWLVESWDCEGRSSRPLAFFPTEAEAAKVASYTGPMGSKSEPREKLMFATAADYEEYSRAKHAMEAAGRAAGDATR